MEPLLQRYNRHESVCHRWLFPRVFLLSAHSQPVQSPWSLCPSNRLREPPFAAPLTSVAPSDVVGRLCLGHHTVRHQDNGWEMGGAWQTRAVKIRTFLCSSDTLAVQLSLLSSNPATRKSLTLPDWRGIPYRCSLAQSGGRVAPWTQPRKLGLLLHFARLRWIIIQGQQFSLDFFKFCLFSWLCIWPNSSCVLGTRHDNLLSGQPRPNWMSCYILLLFYSY